MRRALTRPPSRRPRSSPQGFTLIELALVMVIIGILTGGGIGLMKTLTERKARQAGVVHLDRAEEALGAFLAINGRLPWADTDGDGEEDVGVTDGELPFLTLSLPPVDGFNRPIKYEVQPALTLAEDDSCAAVSAGLSGAPSVVEMMGPGTPLSVGAVLVSAGFKDADGDGDVFDIVSGSPGGDNTDGRPTYVRGPPIDGFDDLIRYLSESDVFAAANCRDVRRTAQITVTNTSAATIYLHDTTLGTCLGTVAPSDSSAFKTARGDSVELRDDVDYDISNHVDSSPAGPVSASDDFSLSTL